LCGARLLLHREGPTEKAGKELVDKALECRDEMKKAGKRMSDKFDEAGDKMRGAAPADSR
jgi:hypothetical protein